MALPHPTGRPGLLRIPAPAAGRVDMRLAPLADRDVFDPPHWRHETLSAAAAFPGWWECDVDTLGLADGAWEYDFVLDGDEAHPIADPWAEELTRFNSYRGIMQLRGGRRVRPEFRWADELPAGVVLPNNHQIVIYEMPVRWMSSGTNPSREVNLATFGEVIFEHLDELQDLGINTIELLPVQDSPDTLNWGYGTRFFFAPDFDMGTPVDLKFFVKSCHRRGIRVILDVVMNHAAQCPVEQLAKDWYMLSYAGEEGDRNDWGGSLFRYRRSNPYGFFAAREFLCEMGEFWVREYHVDGFRIDEFKSINHWEFIQTFRERSWAAHRALFPTRPFLVVAEDTNRRFEITRDAPANPNGRQLVDAMWNFSFQDDGRRLVTNQLYTQWGQPSRRDRIRALVTGFAIWDEYTHGFREGYGDMAQAVNYLTSHDVEAANARRMMNYLFGALLQLRGLGDGGVENVRRTTIDLGSASPAVKDAHAEALDRVRSAFALLMTSVGIPMFLAGEEFADVHDFDAADHNLKMSDPVSWNRLNTPGHRELRAQVRELIRLRTSHGALQRNETDFFYFHPDTDQNDGARVFAFARTGGQATGSDGQVAVIVNAGAQDFANFDLPWPWTGRPHREIARPANSAAANVLIGPSAIRLSLAPFQIRVFATG